ncbi:FecR [Pseudomonas sp. M47T1]|uniref:FecR domain-containing protein n=1 Tax=unclassified Pseudomonas TaxID=196821 RepID=UPI00026066F0|nr:FecR family protein [Pseudomonas sp. M47T1]EIK98663.1 FecR [Pseudomonas sp. M47T1]
MSPTGPVCARVLDAAIQWQLALDGSSAAQQDEFARWHAADEEHARAWQQLGMLDQRLRVAPAAGRKALLSSAEQARKRVRKLGSGLASVVLVLGLASFGVKQWLPVGYWLADQRTATGEQRTLTLADGTQVELNTHSAIDVRFDQDQRLIVLREGEIMVQTGHPAGEQRPFIVETRDGRLRALGTRFLVRREEHGTRLGVLKSAVAAHARELPGEIVLHEGQQMLMQRDALSEAVALNPGADAWTRGMLVVDNARLGDLAQELSRYRPGHLGVSAKVADLRITGSFPLNDTDLALRALLPTLPIQIQKHTRWWVTLEARPATTQKL